MQNFLDPAILFFVFGLFAGAVRSNLEIPPQIARFLSLYLLMALGLKGGFALAKSGLTVEVVVSLGCAIVMATVVPAIGYTLLKQRLSRFDAAAIAATYGSVSAVTFITAVQYMDMRDLVYGGHMAAAMALMESPAIVMAVVLANLARQREGVLLPTRQHGLGKVLHESFTDGAQLLLLGAMVVGIVTGEAGQKAMQPFSGDLFKGMLAFFLLDMGLVAARNFGKLAGCSPWLLSYALVGPIVHATLALGLAAIAGLSPGNGALLIVLSASASYIAVPAVVREAIPEASPSLYFGMSLGITFPFNILIGIPLYVSVAHQVL